MSTPRPRPRRWPRPRRAARTSAWPARRSSTGRSPATTAARSSSGSRTPTRSATPRSPTTRILDLMRWLGLDWDEGPSRSAARSAPYRQTERGDIYADVLARLRDVVVHLRLLLHHRGGRRAPQGVRLQGDGVRRLLPRADRRAASRRSEAEGRAPVVRFRMPDGSITWTDLVRGEITFETEFVPDFALVPRQRRPALHAGQPGRRRADGDHPRAARRGPALQHARARSRCYDALVEARHRRGDPAVRPPALRHGRGQQEALQARPRGAPARLPRPGLPARGAAQLPRAARLGDRRGPRRLHARGDGRRRSTSRTSTPTRRASTSRRPRRSTPRTCGCCRSRRSPSACCRSSRRPASSRPGRPRRRGSCSTRRCRWSPSGSTSSPRPSTCSASCSSTRPTSPATRPTLEKLLDRRRSRVVRVVRRRSSALERVDRPPRSRRRSQAELVEELGLKPRNAFGPVRVAVTGRRVCPPLFESLELLGRERSLARLRERAVCLTDVRADQRPDGLRYHLVQRRRPARRVAPDRWASCCSPSVSSWSCRSCSQLPFVASARWSTGQRRGRRASTGCSTSTTPRRWAWPTSTSCWPARSRSRGCSPGCCTACGRGWLASVAARGSAGASCWPASGCPWSRWSRPWSCRAFVPAAATAPR